MPGIFRIRRRKPSRRPGRSRGAEPAQAELLEFRTLLSTFYVNSDTGSDENSGRRNAPFASIQRAIDTAAAAAGNDSVIIEDTDSGYRESLVINDPAGLRLIARSDEPVSILADSTHGLIVEHAELVDIRNLSFQGALETGVSITGAGRVRLQGVSVGGGHDGIVINNSGRVDLRNVVTAGHGNNGVWLESVETAVMIGGDFSQNGRTGISVVDVDQFVGRGINSSENGRRGIFIDQAEKAALRDSEFLGNAHDGVRITGVAERAALQNISSAKNGQDGIDASDSANLSVRNSTIVGNAYDGLEVDQLTGQLYVRDAQISENGSEGITIDEASRVVIRDTVTRENKDHGVELHEVAYAQIIGLQSLNNKANSVGVSATDVGTLAISKSQISGHANSAILGNATDHVRITSTMISGNGAGETGSVAAVRLSEADSVQLRLVTVSENGGHGIQLTDAKSATIRESEIRENAGTGLLVQNGERVNVRTSSVANNGERGMLISNANSANIRHATFINNGHDGLKVSLANQVSLSHVHSLGNAQDGFDLSSVSRINATNIGATANQFDGFEVDDVERLSLRTGEFQENGSEGITLDTVDRVSLRGIESHRNGDHGLELKHVQSASVVDLAAHQNANASGLHFTAVAKMNVVDATISGHEESGIVGLESGRISFTRVLVTENSTETTGGGVHISNAARLIIRHSQIVGNAAVTGGGVFAKGLTDRLVIQDSDILDNVVEGKTSYGGGLWTNARTFIQRSEVSGNYSTGIQTAGAGIYATQNADVRINDSTIAENSARGRLSGVGEFSYALGGGMYVGHGAQARLHNTTISGNSASMDTSFGPDGTEYRARGGGIYASSHTGTSVYANHTTIAFNRAEEGGGAYSYGTEMRIRNSIVSDNKASQSANVNDKVISLGYNLSDGSLTHATDLIDEAFLLELADNGGSTRTHAVGDNSAAIDAARGGLKKDQRGTGRSTPDIGAFELIERTALG